MPPKEYPKGPAAAIPKLTGVALYKLLGRGPAHADGMYSGAALATPDHAAALCSMAFPMRVCGTGCGHAAAAARSDPAAAARGSTSGSGGAKGAARAAASAVCNCGSYTLASAADGDALVAASVTGYG